MGLAERSLLMGWFTDANRGEEVMAGSFRHVARVKNGKLRFDDELGLLDHMGDAHGAIEEMFDMIEFLSGGDLSKIHAAHEHHCVKRYGGLHRKETPEEYFEEDDEEESDEVSP